VELYLTEILNTPVLDRTGDDVGRVSDVLISLGEIFPRVCAVEIKRDKQTRLISKEDVDYFSKRVITLKIAGDKIVLYQPSSRDLFLVKDLLDRQIIDIYGAKVVRVNDLKLMRFNADFHLAGADIGLSGLIRRLNLERPVKALQSLFKKPHHEHVIAWNFVELIPGEKPKVKLTVEQNKINQLHPADIAEILTGLSPQDRAVVMETLDEEKAASALGEVETEITLDILDDLSKEKVASILKEMNPDDAADILGELPKEKVSEILSTLELREAADLKDLLKHPEHTAGGLMTTEFISLSEKLTVEQTIQHLREKAPDAETIY
jgi:flagellar motility protein MotE (MotC chaperone)/sporulation protein YlmC with PRC-barrel domain